MKNKFKKNKYYNQKTLDGFDSKKERSRYFQLEMLQKAGVIKCLAKQTTFTLIETFKDKQGNTERGIKYIADFVYYDNEKKSFIIEDVKSPITRKLPSYIIKRKLVKKIYPDYLFLEI